MIEKVNDKCTKGNCPFYPHSEARAWGMSPEAMAELQREHEEDHIDRICPHCNQKLPPL